MPPAAGAGGHPLDITLDIDGTDVLAVWFAEPWGAMIALAIAGTGREEPVQAVTQPACFLSKYEMDQAQWQRSVGGNPSLAMENGLHQKALNPVNQVSWQDCDTATRRLGLTLPTEELWEYAARAGTTTTWWTGDTIESTVGKDNFQGTADGKMTIGTVDGWAANPFGLHCMLGNVTEWCAGHPWRYGTEKDSAPETQYLYAARGGNARLPADGARSATRRAQLRLWKEPTSGLRPARAVTRRP